MSRPRSPRFSLRMPWVWMKRQAIHSRWGQREVRHTVRSILDVDGSNGCHWIIDWEKVKTIHFLLCVFYHNFKRYVGMYVYIYLYRCFPLTRWKCVGHVIHHHLIHHRLYPFIQQTFIYFILVFDIFFRQERKEEGGETETSICHSTYLCSYRLSLAYALTRELTCNLGVSGQHSNRLTYPARAQQIFIESLLCAKTCA